MPRAVRSNSLAKHEREMKQRRAVAESLALLDWMLGFRDSAFKYLGVGTRDQRRAAVRLLRSRAARSYPPKEVIRRRKKLGRRLDRAARNAGITSQLVVQDVRDALAFLAVHDETTFNRLLRELGGDRGPPKRKNRSGRDS